MENTQIPQKTDNRYGWWRTMGLIKVRTLQHWKVFHPPTKPLKRAHYTAILWNESVSGCMPNMDPCQFGWETVNKSLMRIKLSNGVEVAPQEVLEMTRCKCITSGWRTKQCSCQQAGLFCSELCGCKDCKNKKSEFEQTNRDADAEDDDDFQNEE